MSRFGRAAHPASSAARFDVLEVLAAALIAHAPGHLFCIPEDVFGAAEVGLHGADAHDLAAELIEDLARRGFVVARAS